jgi:hypothetical protein
MRVEADMFSGRPNPTWSLGRDEADSLAELLGRLQPAAPGAEPTGLDGLGYRGILLHGEGALPGCTQARFARGAVIAECEGGPRAFVDQARAVERWLVESGRRSLDPDIYQVLQRELNGPVPDPPHPGG